MSFPNTENIKKGNEMIKSMKDEPSIRHEATVEILDKGQSRLVNMVDFGPNVRGEFKNPIAKKGSFYVFATELSKGEEVTIDFAQMMIGPFDTKEAARDWALRDHLPYGVSLTEGNTYAILELSEMFTIRIEPAKVLLDY